jgi:hypothetical protein
LPPKIRPRKKRLTFEEELFIWAIIFESSYDYFSEARIAYGLPDENAVRAAARDAWQRLGHVFLARRNEPPTRHRPWALAKFGPPPR